MLCNVHAPKQSYSAIGLRQVRPLSVGVRVIQSSMTTVGALLRQLLVNGTAALSATLSPGETWPSSAGMQRQWTETTAGPTAPPPPPPRAADDATLNATAAVAAVAVAPSAKNIYSQSLLNISRWLAAGNGTLSGTYDTDSSNANAGFRVAGDATTATTAVGERVTAAVAVGAAVNATTADALATVAATAGHERVSFAFTDDYDIYAQMWRDNLTFFNETANVTSLGDDGGGGVKPPAYWALLLLIFPVLTVFGNVLVVLSVYFERSLRSPTNYFIVSLAVADIMVAVLVMPLAVYVEVRLLLLLLLHLLLTFVNLQAFAPRQIQPSNASFFIWSTSDRPHLYIVQALNRPRSLAVRRPSQHHNGRHNTFRPHLRIHSIFN